MSVSSLTIPKKAGGLQSQRIIYIPSAYTNFPFSSQPLDEDGPYIGDRHTQPQETRFTHSPHNSHRDLLLFFFFFHRDLLNHKLNHDFPCSKTFHGCLVSPKTKLQSLQKEVWHDPSPVTPLVFAQDLLWGAPTSPWRPAPHLLPREAFLDFSSHCLRLLLHLLIVLRAQLKITTSYTFRFLPTLQPLAHCLLGFCPNTQIS